MKLQLRQAKSGRTDNMYSYIASTCTMFNFVINVCMFCFHKIVIRFSMNLLVQVYNFKETA